MRPQQTIPITAKPSKDRPEDLVYFRFGKAGTSNLLKVRAIADSKGCTMANVIRDLIGRGIADYETEQAIIAAHKGGGTSTAINAGN